MSIRFLFRYSKTCPEIIRLAEMRYVRFPLSLRNVEDHLHARGVDVIHEAARYWWHRFGSLFYFEIRKRLVAGMKSSNWPWHPAEMFVKINCETHYLCRAVDHEVEVLDSYLEKTRDKKAVLKFPGKSVKRHGRPHDLVTDMLRSCGAAMKNIGNAEQQATGRWLNNRVENSHPPFRRRERAMLRFRWMRSLQMFASVHVSVFNPFNSERGIASRGILKLNRADVLAEWRQLGAA